MSRPRTIFITGAATGLGQALALHLAQPNTHLLLHHHQTPIEATAQQAQDQGAKVSTFAANLGLPHARDDLLSALQATTGHLNVLIHNAAVFPEEPLPQTTPQNWQQVMEVNLNAVFHLTQGLTPLLSAAGSPQNPARIIHIGDSGANRIVARPTATAYHVAKLGVSVLNRSFAQTLTSQGITVNQISPGFLANSQGTHQKPIPAGRKGEFSDITAALDYLLSPQAHYVSGADITVSGGWNL